MAIISLGIFIAAMAYSVVHTKAYRWTLLLIALFPGVITAAMNSLWSALVMGGGALVAASFNDEKCFRVKAAKITGVAMVGTSQLVLLLFAIRHGWYATPGEFFRLLGYSLYLAPEQYFVSLGTLGDIFLAQLAYWYPLVPLAVMIIERRKAPRVSRKVRLIGLGMLVFLYLMFLLGLYLTNGPLVIVTNADYVFYYCIKGMDGGRLAPLLLMLPVLCSKKELTQENLAKREPKLPPPHLMYMAVALIFGIIFSFVSPLGAEADGNMHYYRSCDVAYGNVLFPFVTLGHNPGIEQVPSDYDNYLISTIEPDSTSAGSLKELHRTITMTSVPQAYKDPRSYASLFYYPQALGIRLAMKRCMTVNAAGIFGHLFNMLVYVAITTFALAVMPSRKSLLAASMLAPICIFQSASLSSDTMLNAFCFLFIALVCRLAYGEPRTLGIPQMLPLGVLLLLVYMNKYVYVVLGLLVFLIPRERFGGVKKYIRTFAVSLAPLVLYVTWQLVFGDLIPSYNLTDLGETAHFAYPGYEGMSQLQFVIQYPIEFIKVMVRTVVRGLSDYVISYGSLGWNNMPLGMLIFAFPMVLMTIAVPKEKIYAGRIKPADRVIPIVTAALVFFAVVCSIYIFDVVANGTGGPVVDGIQGRYFVCLPVLIGMAIDPPEKKSTEPKNFVYTMLAMAAVLAWALVVYYRHAYLLGY